MAIKDNEGLIFRELRKKVLNEEPEPKNNNAQPDITKNEVINHIKISIFSGLKLGIGITLGSFIGMIIISTILLITGLSLAAIAGSYLNVDVLAYANMTHLI
ncbi:MAG: hypothetical protein DRN71_04045 [Candidatus Nanohalarchaeota archaeon]|nr:MAG: hypothetical protein DRN71_04045 [Candidatus Nanohaloarchaeota archaeon]